MKSRIIAMLLALMAIQGGMAQAVFSHKGAVSSVASATSSSFFTAGEDGFVVKWNADGTSEHYQVGNSPIKLITSEKDGGLVAVYESDGAVNRVSVWDWKTKQRKYARRFNDTVTCLSFSPKGTYLVVGVISGSGVVFLTVDAGSVVKKLKTNIGSVTHAALSATEQTMCTYSPVGGMGGAKGVITYTDMKTGFTKMNNGKELRFSTISELKQAVLFHNNVFLAGVKDDEVFIIAADSGEIAASIKAVDPVILQDASNANLYYITGSGAERTLMFVRLDGRRINEAQAIIPVGTSVSERITAGAAYGGTSVFASSKGNVYMSDVQSASVSPLTVNTYERVLDVASYGNSFYFLTAKRVIKSSYDNSLVVHIAANDGKANMAVWDEGIVLWSRNTLRPVVLLDTAHSDMTLDYIGGDKAEAASITLFTPKAAINALHISYGKVIYVEGGRSVMSYDIASRHSEEMYSGDGIKDAVLTGGALYVAKSAAGSGALVKVDIITHEALPLKLTGNVAFSLATDGVYLYGIKIINDSSGGKKSIVFSYNLATRIDTSLVSFASEDVSAFVILDDKRILTDIGHLSALVYNTATRKSVTLTRAAALPIAAGITANRAAVVGADGAVYWYNSDRSALLIAWHLIESDGTLVWKE